MKPLTIGIIGCGTISSIYLKNCSSFTELYIKALADLDRDKAVAQAEATQFLTSTRWKSCSLIQRLSSSLI